MRNDSHSSVAMCLGALWLWQIPRTNPPGATLPVESSSCGFYDPRRVRRAVFPVIQHFVGVPSPLQASSLMETIWKMTLGWFPSTEPIPNPKENLYFDLCHQGHCNTLPMHPSLFFSLSCVLSGLCHTLDSVAPLHRSYIQVFKHFYLCKLQGRCPLPLHLGEVRGKGTTTNTSSVLSKATFSTAVFQGDPFIPSN